MYHYVRDFNNTNFPNINGLDIRKFEIQIKYLNSNYNILEPWEVHKIVKEDRDFKINDCWLTFDDGYSDHYDFVLPILELYGLKGSFFSKSS